MNTERQYHWDSEVVDAHEFARIARTADEKHRASMETILIAADFLLECKVPPADLTFVVFHEPFEPYRPPAVYWRNYYIRDVPDAAWALHLEGLTCERVLTLLHEIKACV